ncbi:MAG: hypothetical protein R2796_10115 [Chitinophagaceae bacterium]|nr:hypothetical protein [Chitinophagaceae bacterium]
MLPSGANPLRQEVMKNLSAYYITTLAPVGILAWFVMAKYFRELNLK